MTEESIRRIEEASAELAKKEAARGQVLMNQVLDDGRRRGLGADPAPIRKANLDRYAGDSSFGPEWGEFLDKVLKQIDSELWS